MSNRKNGNGGSKAGQPELDLQAFELQIDQEIDSLFVPAALTVPLVEPALEGITEAVVADPVFVRNVDRLVPEKPLKNSGLDLTAFEVQIDKEIDNLFVPHIEAAMASDSPAAVPDVPVHGSRIPKFLGEEKPCVAQSNPNAADRLVPSELPALIEAFNVAYLSLDWEFSAENLQNLDRAINKLAPYCHQENGTLSLFKILKSIIQQMKAQPSAISPPLIELIRDTQNLFRPLLTKDVAGTEDKESLRQLVKRYQAMREEQAGRKLVMDQSPVQSDAEAGYATSRSNAPGSRIDWQSWQELREWLEVCRSDLNEGIEGLREENHRLAQIEEILAKTPALKPLTVRLSKIRSNLDKYIMIFKGKDDDWIGHLQWMYGFENRAPEVGQKARSTAPISVPEPAAAEVAKKPETCASQPVEVRKEQVCLFRLSGKPTAIPAAHLVKIEKASAGKVKKILKRGYATLKDFKPFFKGIRTGLFGAWNGLPEDILKAYRFLPIPGDKLHPSSQPFAASPSGILLVSSGPYYGILFTDPAGVQLQNDTPITLLPSAGQSVLGTIENGSEEPIEVFNMEHLLKNIHQGPMQIQQ